MITQVVYTCTYPYATATLILSAIPVCVLLFWALYKFEERVSVRSDLRHSITRLVVDMWHTHQSGTTLVHSLDMDQYRGTNAEQFIFSLQVALERLGARMLDPEEMTSSLFAECSTQELTAREAQYGEIAGAAHDAILDAKTAILLVDACQSNF